MKVFEIIEQQQKGNENKPRFMIGEQLKEIARNEPKNAELLEQDLQVKEMTLEAAEKKFQEYADKNHGKASCFCISPKVAETILREFYGLLAPEEQQPEPGESEAGYIDLSTFL